MNRQIDIYAMIRRNLAHKQDQSRVRLLSIKECIHGLIDTFTPNPILYHLMRLNVSDKLYIYPKSSISLETDRFFV